MCMCTIPLARRMSFQSVTIAATTGALAEVPDSRIRLSAYMYICVRVNLHVNQMHNTCNTPTIQYTTKY